MKRKKEANKTAAMKRQEEISETKRPQKKEMNKKERYKRTTIIF